MKIVDQKMTPDQYSAATAKADASNLVLTESRDYATEFERAMRGCRRNIQRRMEQQQGESGEPTWSDVPDDSRSKR